MGKKVVLITGASGGIGRAISEKILKNSGYKVYGVSRNEKKLKYLSERENGNYKILDITDGKNIRKCVAEILEAEETIDILINNAGYGLLGAVEDIDLSEAKKQFEVNLFGLAELSKLVIPEMRKKGSGKIINISSIAGKTWIPFGGWYNASKFAVEGLSNAMRNELKDFGIDVVIIEPGAIKTNWADIAAENLLDKSGQGIYKEKAEKQAKKFNEMYSDKGLAVESSYVADVVFKAVESSRPKSRYAVPFHAKALLFFNRILPDKIMDLLINKVMG
jgi:short-subunit dehydrogenase